MAYSEADKRDIALQNANNAAAAIVGGLVSGDANKRFVGDIPSILNVFDILRDHIFNGTRGVTATAVAVAPAASGAPAAAQAVAASNFTGADNDLLPLGEDGAPRFKGPKGKYVGKTLAQILDDSQGRGYLEFVSGMDKAEDYIKDGVKAFLARHPK